jgi:sugar phosphate isomerase/epimerase
MKLSIVTDELRIPQDEAIPMVGEWGFDAVELRGLAGGRIPDGDTGAALALIKKTGLRVTGLSPGVFKCASDELDISAHLARLEKTLSMCGDFSCQQVIIFSLQQEQPTAKPPGIVVAALREAGTAAARYGVRLAIENEPDHTAVGCGSLAKLIDAVGMENVGANWDPGNAYPYDAELDSAVEILGDRIFNVHVKDTGIRSGKRVFGPVGHGDIDWRTLIRTLAEAAYDGYLVIETHCEPGIEKSLDSVTAVRQLLTEA